MAQKILPRSLRLSRWAIPIYSFYGKKLYASLYFKNLWSNIQIFKTFLQSSIYKPRKRRRRFAFYKQLILCGYWNKQLAYSRQDFPIYFRMNRKSLQLSYNILSPRFHKKRKKIGKSFRFISK